MITTSLRLRGGRMAEVPAWVFSLWAMTAAFGTYFCMYGFRKPFTAGTYADLTLGGMDYKTILVASQVIGYMVSKFIGIKVIAEIEPRRRIAGILALIGLAQLALLGFGVVPPPYNALCLFLNGLPLGMVFGLVLGVLEGRMLTEVLTAGLCASFIVADGFTKTVGGWLLQAGLTEAWMPFAAGAVFILPLLAFVWMLDRIPPPDARDVMARSARSPMTRADRRDFFLRYAFGLTALILMYLAVTILRSIRADFAPEIWAGLGYENRPGVFTESEIYVGLAVVGLTALSVVLRDNRRAFFTAMIVSLGGLLLIPVALLGLEYGLPPFPFMVLLGLGLYLPYVAVHTTIFERLIAMTRDRGNIGYLMYLADSFGYLGYVGVMLGHGAFRSKGGFLQFFLPACWTISVMAIVCLLACLIYFVRRSVAPNVVSDPSVAVEAAT